MSDRILMALPDGRWLVLHQKTFTAALAAGAEFAMPKARQVEPVVDQLLTAEQIAGRLKLPISWIEEATRQGRLPFHEFGRYRRYSLPEVMEATRQERRDGRAMPPVKVSKR